MEGKQTQVPTASTRDAIPPGWNYNPAAWSERIPIVVLAVIGFLIATYLSIYQLKWIETIWEPFFGNGSQKILNSSVSRVLPVPDGVLGALSYLTDAVAGVVGSTRRWKTMPWIVVVFGIAVGPLGFVSVMLVVLQPVLFDAWCTLCLASALISVVMIAPTMDEFLAGLQYLKRVKQSGLSLWKAFWGSKEIYEKVQ